MTKLQSALHSRRFRIAIAGVAVALPEEFGLSIAPETILDAKSAKPDKEETQNESQRTEN